jgi:hypothetical protein
MRIHQLEDQGVREARWQVDRARAAWREHTGTTDRPSCVHCFVASQTRRGRLADRLCPTGRQLLADRDSAAAVLGREQEAAARPNPDQEALFALPEAESR